MSINRIVQPGVKIPQSRDDWGAGGLVPKEEETRHGASLHNNDNDAS